ncbi:MAG: Y-family DNA polymerase [Verrucomicrobiota bacterium]
MRFALVDCNNFYCSCERVFNPGLMGVPVVVLSNNDGCVIARSEESKKLGVEMGTPAFKNEEMFKKNGIQVFSSNYALYGDMSARVMGTMRTMVEQMEVYSIDEAFLALDASQGIAFARELRSRVRQWTGIPVSVGIGPTKTLAKLANRYAKKNPSLNGVFDLTTVEPDEILAKIECQDIWGVGRRTSAKLARSKILTALDLKNADMALIRNALGVVGERIARELNGISCMELEELPASKKAIASARSFGHRVESLVELEEALATYIARVGEKLRTGKLLASRISVFLETNHFRPELPQYHPGTQATFLRPTNQTPELIGTGLDLLRKIYRPGYQYKKTGVMVTDLVDESSVQMSLFGNEGEKHRIALQKAVDGLNKRLGRNAVSFGSMGLDEAWQMRQERKSRCFTTRWDDLLVVS